MKPELTFQVSYGECDVVGIAYFAMFYPWMERTSSGWLYAHGLRSGELADELGVFTVGVHSSCEYRAMVRVFDELTCRLVLDRLGTTSYVIGYDFVRTGDGVTVAHGTLTFVCRDPATGGKAAIPARLLELLHSLPSQA